MTIYTAKAGEKKEEKDEAPPEVVTHSWVPDDKLAKEKEAEAAAVPTASVVAVSGRRRGKHNAANVCIIICAVIVLGLGILGGVYLYKHLTRRPFHGWCGVEYYEKDLYKEGRKGNHGSHDAQGRRWKGHHGKFEEEVEIDKASGNYERINVPAIEECRSATIVHDFSVNYTAIVDKDSHRCFIMRLNRTLVSPPKDFWDLIQKLKSGYYMPKAEILRQYYSVEHPAILDLKPYGFHIWHDCRWYTSYKLRKRSAPGITKRSTKHAITPLVYSTGSGGKPLLPFYFIYE